MLAVDPGHSERSSDTRAVRLRRNYLPVTEIAKMAIEAVGLPAGQTTFEYTGGDRGWKRDVPIVRLNFERIRSLGWKNERSCKETMRDRSPIAIALVVGALVLPLATPAFLNRSDSCKV